MRSYITDRREQAEKRLFGHTVGPPVEKKICGPNLWPYDTGHAVAQCTLRRRGKPRRLFAADADHAVEQAWVACTPGTGP